MTGSKESTKHGLILLLFNGTVQSRKFNPEYCNSVCKTSLQARWRNIKSNTREVIPSITLVTGNHLFFLGVGHSAFTRITTWNKLAHFTGGFSATVGNSDSFTCSKHETIKVRSYLAFINGDGANIFTICNIHRCSNAQQSTVVTSTLLLNWNNSHHKPCIWGTLFFSKLCIHCCKIFHDRDD